MMIGLLRGVHILLEQAKAIVEGMAWGAALGGLIVVFWCGLTIAHQE